MAHPGTARRRCSRGRGVITAGVTLLGCSEFPQASAFVFSTPASSLAAARGGVAARAARGSVTVDGWTCRPSSRGAFGAVCDGGARRGVSGVRTRMSTEEQAAETAMPEMLPPPDREKGLEIVRVMEAESKASGKEDLGAYSTALIPSFPEPPYYFKVPGEFGNDTLCTDPEWHLALNCLSWVGCPVEVEHDEDEEEPNLVMGQEEYDDPRDLVTTLPERCMLCDFVDTLPRIGKDVAKVYPAWLAVYLNEDPAETKELEKTMMDRLKAVEESLKYAKGDLLEGEELTIGDLQLAVTTYHMMAAFGGEDPTWKFPKQLPNVRKHSEMMHDMMCFHDVMPTKEDVAKRYKTMKDEQ